MKKRFRAFWLILILLVVGLFSYLYYKNWCTQREQDERYQIVAVAQRPQSKESLPTVYLAELLQLSVDQPTNLYLFDLKKAEEKLLASHVIKKALVHRVKPGTVLVEYALATPIAFIGECANGAVDAEGVLFPFHPFFTPKKLPILYLGLEEGSLTWGTSLQSDRLTLAFAIMDAYQKNIMDLGLVLEKIDLAAASAASCGERQVVLQLCEKECSYLVRLDPNECQQGLADFARLREELTQEGDQVGSTIVDLRITGQATVYN